VASRHELLRWRHGGHAKARSWNIANGTSVVGQREVIIARFGRVLFKRVEVIILAFEVFFLVVTQRLAIRTRLMCATMSKI
jgi:hypothetical protein